MGCVGKVFFSLIAVALCIVYATFCVQYGGWKYMAYMMGSAVVAVLLIYIANFVMSIVRKHPVFTGKKASKLEEARQLDESNALKNQTNKSKVDAQWEKDREKRLKDIDELLPQLQQELAEAKSEFNEKVSEIEENDCLGEDEKSIQIIQMLIYFIESRRADSIKEALHEYDKAMTNKQMVELEEKRLAMQKSQMEREASDRKKLIKLQEEANDRARWAATDNARQREEMIKKLGMIETIAWSSYHNI